jgi:hypothetical protein
MDVLNKVPDGSFGACDEQSFSRVFGALRGSAMKFK